MKQKLNMAQKVGRVILFVLSFTIGNLVGKLYEKHIEPRLQ